MGAFDFDVDNNKNDKPHTNLTEKEILYEIYSCVHTIRVVVVIYAILTGLAIISLFVK